MSNPFLQQIDPSVYTELGRAFEGRVPLDAFKRLLPLLTKTDGSVEIKIQFERDEDGYKIVTGCVTGCVRVQCQRCTQEMQINLTAHLNLVLLEDERTEMPEMYEPFVLTKETFSMVEMIEDELVLALPFSPKHPEGCGSALQEHTAKTRKAAKPNPFAALAALKK